MTIQSATTLQARSICDHTCVFTLKVIERKNMWAKINYNGKESRTKIHVDDRGEFLMPERYSMAPIFRA
jgi:hypothetical protein